MPPLDTQQKSSESSAHASQVPSQASHNSWYKELLKFAVLAIIIVVPIRTYVAQPFIVNGASMDPTFETGQYLIVDQLTYNILREPERNDVIILKYPREPKTFYIKRIIGLPGETIEIEHGNVTIRNKDNPRGFILDQSFVAPNHVSDDSYNITLRDDEYFVMGDNRAQSSDSRSWGPLPRSLIVGRPLIRLYPFKALDILPGIHTPSTSSREATSSTPTTTPEAVTSQ